MNRLILIGNGFDLAHGLKTSYRDFIDDFWENEKQKVVACIKNKNTFHPIYYIDEYVEVKSSEYPTILLQNASNINGFNWFENLQTSVLKVLSEHSTQETTVYYKNNFLKMITEKSLLQDWVDIEDEYYNALHTSYKNIEKLEILHRDFQAIQVLLEEYLLKQDMMSFEKKQKIEQLFFNDMNKNDFVPLLPSKDYLKNILFLNFNYTSTVKNYHRSTGIQNRIINIHCELGNSENPIIFGYGDEIDEKYKVIENENNNNLFTFIKSFRYSKTNNYKELLRFINYESFQVFIFGHSCGLSDRTLLSTIFEHENCKSIKIYFYDNNGNDNYNDTYMNISRHFKNKIKMRDIIVSKKSSIAYC